MDHSNRERFTAVSEWPIGYDVVINDTVLQTHMGMTLEQAEHLQRRLSAAIQRCKDEIEEYERYCKDKGNTDEL